MRLRVQGRRQCCRSQLSHCQQSSPHIEVPRSPFAFRGRTGNGNYPSQKRSGVRRAAAATAMTRAMQLPFQSKRTSRARGVDVDPAQQDAAQRSMTRNSITKPAPNLPPYRTAIPYSLLPKQPGEPRHHREQRPSVLRGESWHAGKLQRQSYLPISYFANHLRGANTSRGSSHESLSKNIPPAHQ
jgi:hypothetical protein